MRLTVTRESASTQESESFGMRAAGVESIQRHRISGLRRVVLAIAGLLLCAASVVVAPSPATAAPVHHTYVVTPEWWGWCSGSEVVYVSASNIYTGWFARDSGDAVVLLRTDPYGNWNHVALSVKCLNGRWEHGGVNFQSGPNHGSVFVGRHHGYWANWW